MKKRIIAVLLLCSILFGMFPLVQPAQAAVSYRYELDTDGIDPGATYLIVSGNSGNVNALRLNYSGDYSFQGQSVTVTTEDGVTCINTGFTNEADCQFAFSAASTGYIANGSYKVDLENESFTSGSPTTLTFSNQENGEYRISYSFWFWNYYLRYNNGWQRSTTTSNVYLFKLVEHIEGYDVVYDGNGHTSGTVPANAEKLDEGSQYTLLAPTDLRKDEGEDTWLFECWNTAPDGSGTEYAPGEQVSMTENLTLYAQWYMQTKFVVEVITKLNDEQNDFTEFYDSQTGEVNLYVRKAAQDDSPAGEYIRLLYRESGKYSVKVTENGSYEVFVKDAEGNYQSEHGHKVVVYNADANTELLHYTVSYDLDGGSWAAGEEVPEAAHHATTAVNATEHVPAREGYRFLGWKDQNGNLIAPGGVVTDRILQKTTLTAQWDKTVSMTVTVTLDHNDPVLGDENYNGDRHLVVLQLMREENGVNHLVQTVELQNSANYDPATGKTTYTYTFEDLPQAKYHIACVKSEYDATFTYTGEADQDQTADILLQYTPDNKDLQFQVVVADFANLTDAQKALLPESVNVKVSRWQEKDGIYDWYPVEQLTDNNAPVTVMIDPATGIGTGSFPVWRFHADGTTPYVYRIEVTAFHMPDDSLLQATAQTVHYTYIPDGSGLYSAVVTTEDLDGNSGKIPQVPAPTETSDQLYGAFFLGEIQHGIPTATVTIHPLTVTFDAADGTLAGENALVLDTLYRYPDPSSYIPTPNNAENSFAGWFDAEGNNAADLAGKYLPENVTFTAKYVPPMSVCGTITVEGHYELNGERIAVPDSSRAEEVMVILQKNVNGVFNDVDSQIVKLGAYTDDVATGEYTFTEGLSADIQYRIHVLVLNYETTYNNNSDAPVEEDIAVPDEFKVGHVDALLDFAPQSYLQEVIVDAILIEESMRPDSALVQILYRDLGDIHSYDVISQHTTGSKGIPIILDKQTAMGTGSELVWNWHTDGALYEYQAQLSKLYGNVPGAYISEGTAYSADVPYSVRYSLPGDYVLNGNISGGLPLQVLLIPKEFKVVFDMNLGDSDDPIYGMEDYMLEDGSYAHMHTWSYGDQISAFPYREGWVFQGWKNTHDGIVIDETGGNITIGKAVGEDVTLVAQWEKMEGTAYSVRHLELNTDVVLHAAQSFSGVENVGTNVMATDHVLDIPGFNYAGALVDGVYVDKEEDPFLVITDDPAKNLLTIYYLPDGSDGYTEQVESNLNISKTAVLEDNGTYTVNLETYTLDNPITTLIEQDTPLDIIMVLDQSGSLVSDGSTGLETLKMAVTTFAEEITEHSRQHEVDHRMAIVGYASNASDGKSGDTDEGYIYTGGKETNSWTNTGVFDSHGEFHNHNIKGFIYTPYSGKPETASGTPYYAYSADDQEFLLLTHMDTYYHLVTEEEARIALLSGEKVYGQLSTGFVELERNSSGLWLYGDKQLYSELEFFTFHEDVWTHRSGIGPRKIHGYGTGDNYEPADGHQEHYTREETEDASGDPDEYLSVYKDALVPVSVGDNGSGNVTPGIIRSIQSLGANGGTRASYGMQIANNILEATPLTEQDKQDGRIRIVVMFTDGEPGQSGFLESEANAAIAQAYTAKNTHDAYVYAIGLYEGNNVASTSDTAYYMNALSSNYQNAQDMDDIKTSVTYTQAASGTPLVSNSNLYVRYNNTYYQVKYGTVYISSYRQNVECWYFTRNNTNYLLSTTENATVGSNGKVGNYTVYQKNGGYKTPDGTDYYSTTDNEAQLEAYFRGVIQNITTKVTTEIILHNDTILRDVMGQGLVLTPGTVITAYKQKGVYNFDTEGIDWAGDQNNEYVASVTIPENPQGNITSQETFDMMNPEGTEVVKEDVPYINVYNLDAENPTNPDKANYLPHTIDISGYDFAEWFISENHTEGYKLVVEINRIEARDDVVWGRSTETNGSQSGLWLPADDYGVRELLLPFDQPSTIFVERAFVLDYGKTFTLSDWYFDDDGEKIADAKHADFVISDGMNWFDADNPNTANSTDPDNPYGNTKYSNVQVQDGQVTYTPITTNWGDYEQFYVFGNTWRKTVLAQDANENGNLWQKVTVIPANNIYYEDSFISTEDTTINGIDGFTFTGSWSIDETGENPGSNVEIPEHLENPPYGDVHGWSDSLNDDTAYTDGSAHATSTPGASVEFQFTGTGVDVYTRTDSTAGIVMATLYSLEQDGTWKAKTGKIMDNLSVSGTYYSVPTINFHELAYGTYKVLLRAVKATANMTGQERVNYWVDGIRVYNPLGSTTNYLDNTVQAAYGKETNAVFTEIRDILLDYGSFTNGMAGSGAVFIDWIREGQGSGSDTPGVGVGTYEIGTFESIGPKNEVYLTQGQAVVLKVDPKNTYYVGMKSLDGKTVEANVSGIDTATPTTIELTHTTDLYYQVTPDTEGYIIIQNASAAGVLSLTRLRTTNLTTVVEDGGVQDITPAAALMTMRSFQVAAPVPGGDGGQPPQDDPPIEPTPIVPDNTVAENVANRINALAERLFMTVKTWLQR